MKLTLRFETAIGPRVGVLEVSDEATAQAILNAHSSQNHDGNADAPCGALVEEMPRISMKDHLARHRRAKAKAAKLTVVPRASKVVPFKQQKAR